MPHHPTPNPHKLNVSLQKPQMNIYTANCNVEFGQKQQAEPQQQQQKQYQQQQQTQQQQNQQQQNQQQQ